jgi:hypothetical protein
MIEKIELLLKIEELKELVAQKSVEKEGETNGNA